VNKGWWQGLGEANRGLGLSGGVVLVVKGCESELGLSKEGFSVLGRSMQ